MYAQILWSLRLLFGYFKFWDEIQNLISNMWQVVIANIFIHGGIIHSYTYSFFIALAKLCNSLPMIWTNNVPEVHLSMGSS